MKPLRTIAAGVLSIAALVTLAAVLLGAFQTEPEPGSGPQLHITTHTRDHIAGYLDDGAFRVEFESRMENPRLVSVQVRINDLVLDASAEFGEDGQKKLIVIDGHGKPLSPEDKRALIALSGALERHLDAYKRELPSHQDLLVRSVGLWAEAPVGYPLERREVRPPQDR